MRFPWVAGCGLVSVLLVTLLLTSLLTLLLRPTAARADWREQCDLDCLLCSDLANPQRYAEGIMKSMHMITPGADHWLFRSDVDLSNDFGLPAASIADYQRLMTAFADQGITVVFALQPTRGMMHRDKVYSDYNQGFDFALARRNLAKLQQQLRAGGAIVPDILPLVDNPPAEEYFFRRDHHWTPAGARVTADIVAQAIRQLPVYEDVASKEYATEPYRILPRDGTMNRALRAICGNSYSFQYVQGYQTYPVQAEGDALFGDSGDPEIVLVGTSNSAVRDDELKNYNFEGFLKQQLHADILNYSLPGAGEDGSLVQYLLSDDYLAGDKPKILIWEFPINFKLEDPLVYRQLIPAVKGGCANAKTSLLQQSSKVKALKSGQRVEILSNTGARRKNLAHIDAFLDIRFSDPNLRDFYVITYYDNGERDKVWFRRVDIVDGGHFLLELSRAPALRKANLLSVFIEASQNIEQPVTVETALCQ